MHFWKRGDEYNKKSMIYTKGKYYYFTKKFSTPTGGFFLAPAEVWRAQKAQKVILADGQRV